MFSGLSEKLSAVFDCIPCKDKRPELFARFIRNNTEGRGQLFTDVDELGNLRHDGIYVYCKERLRLYEEIKKHF